MPYPHSLTLSLSASQHFLTPENSWICNWFGSLDVANSIQFSSQSTFASKALAPYTVNGAQGGTFKTVSNLSFLRVFEAGHEVPYYREFFVLFFFNPETGELGLWALGLGLRASDG